MKHKLIYLAATLFIVLLFSACSKDDPEPTIDEPPIEEPEDLDPEEPESNFFKLIRVQNFAGDLLGNDPEKPNASVFYSLEDNKAILSTYAKTNRWDVAFEGIYNSFISGNNGTNALNAGFGNNATGGIYILPIHFDKVTDIPADNLFKTGTKVYGTDDNGSLGAGMGWYLYDFGGTIMGDGSYAKQHVAYAMGDTTTLANGNIVLPRTVLIRTAKGNYAKIKMISCYKDAFTPDQWYRNTPHMFFTFEYVMVPVGSTKFEIKK